MSGRLRGLSAAHGARSSTGAGQWERWALSPAPRPGWDLPQPSPPHARCARGFLSAPWEKKKMLSQKAAKLHDAPAVKRDVFFYFTFF